MSGRFLRLAVCCLVLHASLPGPTWGQQAPKPDAAQANETAQAFNTEQIDALLAPIALYPDNLLTQILMASTFPLQVVAAGRWLEDSAHKDLKGDALAKALEAQDWDPSVKSLVPFPQVVTMMNANLDWMQQLGYAVADQQAAVLDSVQRLRRQAQSNGSLQSSPQQVVRTEDQSIIIEPAKPDVVYVPSYNPTVVYGTWPYPSYPPVYLPPPAGYVAGTALVSGLAFGAGVAITAGLWGWARPAWGSGNVNVNVNRYNSINANRALNTNRAAMRSNVWQPNRSGGRPAGLTRPPTGPVGRPARQNGLPAGAIGRQQVSVPGSAVRPSAPARSAGAAGTARAQSPGGRAAGQAGQANRAGLGQGGPASRPGSGRSVSRANLGNRPGQLSAGNRAGQQSAFSGMNNGRQASQFGQRGAQSRSMSQARRPSGGFGGASAGGRGGFRGGRGGGRR